jgi:cation transport protein ChaC
MPSVFAYGSLMGDAVLTRHAAQPARLPGYHRAFLHRSRRRWGRPEAPSPILGLAPGGECWGVVFDVPETEGRAVRSAIEKRETAAERRREVRRVETPHGEVEAWVWLSRATHEAAPPDGVALLAQLRAAHGVVGTGIEYVRTLVHALELHGLRDPMVEDLWRQLRA